MKWIYQDIKAYLTVCKCSNCGATIRVNDGGNLPCYCKNCGELEDLGFATDCKEPNRMTDKKDIIKELDGADVFLRNRANSKPAPLNEYDIEILLDIAKICDKSANIIKHQQEDIDKLKGECDRWHREAELNANEIIKLQAEIDRLKDKYEKVYQPIAMVKAEAKAEAIKEFADGLIAELNEYYCEECRIDTLIKERLQEKVVRVSER